MKDLNKMTWDELQAERYRLVAVQSVADEVYKAAFNAAQVELRPIMDELQARDQVQIDAAIVLRRLESGVPFAKK